jgi:hypothetical protein
MELEIKHLTPYLPYKLKGQLIGYPKGTEVTMGLYLSNMEKVWTIDMFNSDVVKPILYPKTHLHNLQNEILIRWGGGLSNRAKAQWLKEITDEMMYSAYTSLRYDFVDFMCEHHIDVFGLIEKGLAEVKKPT